MYLRLGISRSDLNLAHLRIQDGRQNDRNILKTAYFPVCSQQFLLYGSQSFIFIVTLVFHENV